MLNYPNAVTGLPPQLPPILVKEGVMVALMAICHAHRDFKQVATKLR